MITSVSLLPLTTLFSPTPMSFVRMSRSCPLLKVIDFDADEDLDRLVVSPGALYSAQVSPIPPDDVEAAEEAFALVRPESEDTVKDCPTKADRRTSSTWKGFSLKKQLSRVDMKLKHTFSAPAEKSSSGKRSSVFYSGSNLVSPAEKDSGNSSPEVSNSPESEELPSIVLSKETGDEGVEGGGGSVVRPTELPLVDTYGHPIRPPRKDRKRVSVDQKTPNNRSDTRLLSVPNIKYSHGLRDLRRKEAMKQTNQNNQAFGPIIRKISKSSYLTYRSFA